LLLSFTSVGFGSMDFRFITGLQSIKRQALPLETRSSRVVVRLAIHALMIVLSAITLLLTHYYNNKT
jgi:hypothetical protein